MFLGCKEPTVIHSSVFPFILGCANIRSLEKDLSRFEAR